MRMDACNESLILLSTITASHKQQASSFFACLPAILQMFNVIKIPSPPLRFPVSALVNTLVFLVHPDTSKILFPHSADQGIVDRLVHVLDLAVQSYTNDELDYHGPPLIRLLQVAQIAPPHARAHLQNLLLPTDEDREDILGTGDSLLASVLRLSVSIAADRLRVLIPALLFELSDNDPKLLMQNVGYGYVSGFLQVLGVPLTSSA